MVAPVTIAVLLFAARRTTKKSALLEFIVVDDSLVTISTISPKPDS